MAAVPAAAPQADAELAHPSAALTDEASVPAAAAPVIASPASDAEQGPTVAMLPESTDSTQAPAQAASSDNDPSRAQYESRLRAGSPTNIGGYAELHVNMERATGPGDSETTIDMHRFVLFVAHEFSDKIRFYSEVEIEHSIASHEQTDPGEVEIEQAYVDYKLAGDKLALRAGLVLVPMGIINQWHEPPVFHGVERPVVDTVIIPSTWREGALGIVGEPIDGLRYELYVMSGLSAAGFSAAKGLRGGRLHTAEARTNGLAVAARLEYEPMLSAVVGLSGYYGFAGPNADFYDASGVLGDIAAPVAGLSADARGRVEGFEARAELAYFHIGDTRALRNTFDETGTSLGLDVGSSIYGAYGEVAYDLLHTLECDQQLLPFVRLERYDTLAAVSGRAESASDDGYGITELALGLTYRPITQVAFKSDFRLASPDGPSQASGRVDLGVGVMF